YRTSDMARAGGVHVNTVRLYEELGYLPPVARDPVNNYRQFTARHLDQMRVIRLALRISWLGGEIGQQAVAIIMCAASDDLPGALAQARDLAARVEAEHDQAESAADALEAWAQINADNADSKIKIIAPQRHEEHGEKQGKSKADEPDSCRGEFANPPRATYKDSQRAGEQDSAHEHIAPLHRVGRGATRGCSGGGVLTTKQAADLLAVSVDMLRNWERDGLISDIPRDPRNNYRQYGPPQIARLRIIRTLRKARYSTMSILRMLRHLDAGHTDGLREKLDTPHPDDDVYMATDYWLTTVTELVKVAGELVAQVKEMIEKWA
ncbi:MAG: MerR family DNA-binding transcriptional regulator, partial [Anaerolineae bacterium]|nr:MerR family DNA-binding transcriptional regulator [Anaerolineae bacterium]